MAQFYNISPPTVLPIGPKAHSRLNELIEDVRRTLFRGLGKPEPLKGDLKGFWSRQITSEHRLVYVVEGEGAGQCVIVAQCHFRY